MTTTTAKHTRTPWKVLPDTHKIGGHPNHLFRFIATANWTEDDGDFSATGEIIAKLTDSQNIAANASFIVRACNAHDDLLAACMAALEERTLRDELSSIGARARSKHTQTVESIRLDETRKREILARIIEIGRITRAAIRKAVGEA